MANIEGIDKEIDQLQEEIEIDNQYLIRMEYHLRQMRGTIERVFVYRYLDGLPIHKICEKLNCSRAHVYRQLSNIEKILRN